MLCPAFLPKSQVCSQAEDLVLQVCFPHRAKPSHLGHSFGQQPAALLSWGLQKQQMGDTFREVHMQQLQVRSAQYREKIEEKNEDLLQLKLTAAKTVQVLNSCKVSECPSTSVLTVFCF